MRVMITGGAGFIGCNFVRHVLENHPGYQVVVLDKLTYAGRMENLQDVMGRIEFVQGDICDRQAVDSVIRSCDAVVNFAAETHVDRSISDAGSFVRTNVLGTHTLLEAARDLGLEKFVQIGTDEVYGSTDVGSFSEADPLNPSSPYSASKAGADLLARAYFITYGLPVCITRSSNNFGPYQYPEKLIPFFVLRALQGERLPVYGSGKNVRDWLYVRDNCAAIDLVLHKGRPGEIYNIGGGNELSNLEITSRILSHLKKPASLIEHVADRLGHDFRYSIDSAKMRNLGWRSQLNFEEALNETIDWYLKNDGWWRSLL
ncbi:MAG: dTDP-glucose 4,6 dehydratase [Methanosaeta sp. PtaB.Bin039]|nr:MAG: dTDP-glucose 4,6 dehydratase [Methanosaeta sp. PtaB.Bin039]OPY48005.1 MAG: dTDP-glucose 4,6 dehydratase [Methanosaeta sp. PtaU1.Bin028]